VGGFEHERKMLETDEVGAGTCCSGVYAVLQLTTPPPLPPAGIKQMLPSRGLALSLSLSLAGVGGPVQRIQAGLLCLHEGDAEHLGLGNSKAQTLNLKF